MLRTIKNDGAGNWGAPNSVCTKNYGALFCVYGVSWVEPDVVLWHQIRGHCHRQMLISIKS